MHLYRWVKELILFRLLSVCCHVIMIIIWNLVLCWHLAACGFNVMKLKLIWNAFVLFVLFSGFVERYLTDWSRKLQKLTRHWSTLDQRMFRLEASFYDLKKPFVHIHLFFSHLRAVLFSRAGVIFLKGRYLHIQYKWMNGKIIMSYHFCLLQKSVCQLLSSGCPLKVSSCQNFQRWFHFWICRPIRNTLYSVFEVQICTAVLYIVLSVRHLDLLGFS